MIVNKDEEQVCSICFFKIKKPSQKKMLDCDGNHCFHQKCIWKWIVQKNTCPMCRQNVCKYPSFGCDYNEHFHYINALSKRQHIK
jgi:hypothetical protein